MYISRRAALLGSVSALAACAASAQTPAQILADAGGILNLLDTDVPIIAKLDPALIPTSGPITVASIENDIDTGLSLLAKLTPALEAVVSAPSLQTIEGIINDALDVLGGVANAVLPSPLAPYALAIQAIIILAPGIEAFVNSAMGVAGKRASLRAKAFAPAKSMSPAAARAVLGITTLG